MEPLIRCTEESDFFIEIDYKKETETSPTGNYENVLSTLRLFSKNHSRFFRQFNPASA